MQPEDMISNLKDMIGLLEEASPFLSPKSIYSSPIEPLLQVGVDILLRISKILQEDFKLRLWRNPEISFSESEQDSLGNPQQIKSSSPNPTIPADPDTAKIILNFASYLVSYFQFLEASFLEKFSERSALDHLYEIRDELVRKTRKAFFELTKKTAELKRNRYFARKRIYRK